MCESQSCLLQRQKVIWGFMISCSLNLPRNGNNLQTFLMYLPKQRPTEIKAMIGCQPHRDCKYRTLREIEKTRPLQVIKVIHCPWGVTSGLNQILYIAFIQVLMCPPRTILKITIIHCLSTYPLLIHWFSTYPFIIRLSMDNQNSLIASKF